MDGVRDTEEAEQEAGGRLDGVARLDGVVHPAGAVRRVVVALVLAQLPVSHFGRVSAVIITKLCTCSRISIFVESIQIIFFFS